MLLAVIFASRCTDLNSTDTRDLQIGDPDGPIKQNSISPDMNKGRP